VSGADWGGADFAPRWSGGDRPTIARPCGRFVSADQLDRRPECSHHPTAWLHDQLPDALLKKLGDRRNLCGRFVESFPEADDGLTMAASLLGR